MPNKKWSLILLAAFFFTSLPVFSNSLMLSGLGARAIAMGGAFVGLADDFTAVYWNPAAIGFMKQKGFGITGMDLRPSISYGFSVDIGLEYLMAPERQLTLAKKHNRTNYAYGMPGHYSMHGVIPQISLSCRY